jgi:hypothetical protein
MNAHDMERKTKNSKAIVIYEQIIRNNLPTPFLSLILTILIKSENTKNTSTISKHNQNPKRPS